MRPYFTSKKQYDWWYKNVYLACNYWLEVRKEVYADRGGKCEHCGTTERLDVHHINYKNIGNERLDGLKLVCRDCHKRIHLRIKKKKFLTSIYSFFLK